MKTWGKRSSTLLQVCARVGWLLISLLPWRPLAAQADDAYPTVRIASGVYVHYGTHEEVTRQNLGAYANMGFIVGSDSVAVVDTGGSYLAGLRLRAAVRAVTELPIRYVVNTHDHPDHSFGNSAFRQDRPHYVGHRRLERALLTRGTFLLQRQLAVLGELGEHTELVPPDLVVADTLEIDLGHRVLTLRAWPTAHTDNDLTVFDEQTGTLWAGDLIFSERVPVIDGSINGWLEALDSMRNLPAQRVVPGHGSTATLSQAVARVHSYLEKLRGEVRVLINNGTPLLGAERLVSWEARDDWVLFDAYHPRNVIAAYKELEWE